MSKVEPARRQLGVLWLSLGGASMIALVASLMLSIVWSRELLLVFAGICFTLAARYFRWPEVLKKRIILPLLIWVLIGVVACLIWPREKFVPYYCGNKIKEGQQIELAESFTIGKCGMFVESFPFGSGFDVSGITAKNIGTSELQADKAYLSFSSPIKQWGNSSVWRPSSDPDPDSAAGKWVTFEYQCLLNSIRPDHSLWIPEFIGEPMFKEPVKIRLYIEYGSAHVNVAFVIKPPRQ